MVSIVTGSKSDTCTSQLIQPRGEILLHLFDHRRSNHTTKPDHRLLKAMCGPVHKSPDIIIND